VLRNYTLTGLQRIWKRAASALLVLIAGAVLITCGFNDVSKRAGKDIFLTIHDHTIIVENLGALSFHGFDIYYTALNSLSGQKKLSDADKAKVMEAFNKEPGTQVKPALYGIGKGKNLIVVQVEALENEAYLVVSYVRQLIVLQPAYLYSIKEICSGGSYLKKQKM
jgi:phosphoglycerol transferase MdoB-like AlkP superfamily enzyme